MTQKEKVNMSQLIDEAADAMGVCRLDAANLIQKYFLRNILTHLANGQEVSLSPIGVLFPAKARQAKADGEYRVVPKLRPAWFAKRFLSGEIAFEDSEGKEMTE